MSQRLSKTTEWRRKNIEKSRLQRKKLNLKKYGLTLEQHQKIYDQQRGCCALCGIHERELDRALHIDHCHQTGKVRGLLCFDCNTGLGKFCDDPELLFAAVKYIDSNGFYVPEISDKDFKEEA